MDLFQSPTTLRHTLVTLISMLQYSLAAFQQAVVTSHDPDLQEFFTRRALQRVRFVGELESALHRLGHQQYFQKHESSLAAEARLGWLDLAAVVNEQDRAAVLAEVERGEKHVVNAYHNALEQYGWSLSTRAILKKQEDGVEHCYEEVVRLRENLDREDYLRRPMNAARTSINIAEDRGRRVW